MSRAVKPVFQPGRNVLNPLLTNLYRWRLVLGWKKLGWEEKLQFSSKRTLP
jgi:hypothetical protein